ncbi:uncharacterized protein HKW66_Vig0096430 [Vigna angularis]|uniref:Uncharacterized protein n=1 Tax=Phaseolus angularis TaxID=3914 RepID=A0A8T0KQB2_PHAAN|nr:uncharacterized protein HKW66_Vig0096430 [Vigna angularis]
MVNGALCFHHVHKFLLAYCALNLNLRRQHPTCLYFHTRSLLLSHPFNFNHSATPFKPSLLRIPNSRLFSLSCGGSGGNDARGGGCGSNGPNSGGSGGFTENLKDQERWNYAQIRGIKSCFEKGFYDMNEDYGTGI